MSLGCSATSCASSCRRSYAGAEERSAWSSVGSCRLDCTNAQSSQTERLLPIQLRSGRPTDQKESTDEGLSQTTKTHHSRFEPPTSPQATTAAAVYTNA